MPLFDFLCLDCGKSSEVLTTTGSDNQPKCHSCGSYNLKKLLKWQMKIVQYCITSGMLLTMFTTMNSSNFTRPDYLQKQITKRFTSQSSISIIHFMNLMPMNS